MPFEELASVDGAISPTRLASLPLPDDGLYRGDGVFEVVRIYGGRPFALAEHLDRLERSGAAIELPVERHPIEAEIAALLERQGPVEGQLRIVATRGGRRVLAVEELPARQAAVRLATVTYSPNVVLDGVKSISYAANMQASRAARAQGADEALLVRPNGTVLEAPTASVFWVSPDGTLRTPSIDSAVLESITRATIVDALDVEQGRFDVGDVRAASEAFLASTVREVQPVAAIDGNELEAPGPRTQAAQEAYERARDRALASEEER